MSILKKVLNQSGGSSGGLTQADIIDNLLSTDATKVLSANQGSVLKAELDGIVDTTNVAAAGAIMDGDFTTNGLMKRTGIGVYTVDTNTYLTSVSFSDLTTTPTTIAGYGITDAFSGVYADLTGKPTLFSGDYNDLTNTPAPYSLPLATSTVRGGLKIGYTLNGKNYPVQLNNEQAFVNVPWTDTTYSVGDGGLTQNNFTDTLKGKLDGIEAGADITDSTNVAAAGAVMDSDFSTNGLMKRVGVGVYTVDTNNYLTTTPLATNSVIGGVKIGYVENGDNYAVQLSDGKAFVSVPSNGLPNSPTDGNFLVGNGTGWVQESGSTARDSLGLGALDNVTFANLQLGSSTHSTDILAELISEANVTLNLNARADNSGVGDVPTINLQRSGTNLLTAGVDSNSIACVNGQYQLKLKGGSLIGTEQQIIIDNNNIHLAAASSKSVYVNDHGFGYNVSPSTTNTIEEFTIKDANLHLKNDVSNGNPYLLLGANANEALKVQAVYAAGTTDLAYVQLQTSTASGVSNRGQFIFAVDDVNKMSIRDYGLDVTGNITLTGSVDGVNLAQLKIDYDAFTSTTNSPQFSGQTLESLLPTYKFVDTDSTVSAGQSLGQIEWWSKDTSLPNGNAKVAELVVKAKDSSLAPDGQFAFRCADNGGTLIDVLELNTGNIIGNKPLQITDNQNTPSYIGRAVIGGNSHHNDWAWFGHRDGIGSGGNYAVLQNSAGWTLINSASNQKIEFRNNNSTKWTISPGGGIYSYNASGGDKGAGRINCDRAYDDGVQLTCHPLEYYFTNNINVPWWDRVAGVVDESGKPLYDKKGNIINPSSFNNSETIVATTSKGEREISLEDVMSFKPRSKHKRVRSFLKERKDFLDVEKYNNFIKEKQHLPSLPSKDNYAHNNDSVGFLLMRIIEDLDMKAIHGIQTQEKLKEANNKIASLEERISKLEKIINNL